MVNGIKRAARVFVDDYFFTNPKRDFQMIKSIGNFRVIFGLLLLLLSLLLRTAASNGSDFYAEDQSISIQRADEVWKGDLQAAIKQRRTIRVLVSYSNTNFFIDRGRPRGIEYELLNKYEKFLNQNPKSKAIKIKLVYRVLPFDQLIPALLEGRGDIIAAGLTITPERLEKVAFT